jgi:hypothetical protein
MAKPIFRLRFKNKKKFDLALDDFVDRALPSQHLALQKKIAIDLFGKIIEKNPVGNPDLWKSKRRPPGYVGGRSRANWAISVGTPGSSAAADPEGGVKTKDKISGLQEAEGFAAMATAKPGGTIWIYNNVRYIKRLEDGHSKQAPVGMVAVSLVEIAAGLGET